MNTERCNKIDAPRVLLNLHPVCADYKAGVNAMANMLWGQKERDTFHLVVKQFNAWGWSMDAPVHVGLHDAIEWWENYKHAELKAQFEELCTVFRTHYGIERGEAYV